MRNLGLFLFVIGTWAATGSSLPAQQPVEGDWVGGYQTGRDCVYLTPMDIDGREVPVHLIRVIPVSAARRAAQR
jgi:hypothetical protein